jgi:ATP-dependent protease ClpP protease subunit
MSQTKRKRIVKNSYWHNDIMDSDVWSNQYENMDENQHDNQDRDPLCNTDIQMIKFPDKYDKCIFLAGDKEIHFNAHVDGETITRLKKLISSVVEKNKDMLVKFSEDGRIPLGREKDPNVVITYIVNSPGGSVHDVLDFVDYIGILRTTFHNIRFTSIITGMVASAGTIMCVIADKRKMTRFSFSMVHELTTGVSRTNYTRIMTHAEFVQNLHRALVTIYQESRGISLDDSIRTKELEDLLIKESWMTPEQYKYYGFIDEIIAGHRVSRRID